MRYVCRGGKTKWWHKESIHGETTELPMTYKVLHKVPRVQSLEIRYLDPIRRTEPSWRDDRFFVLTGTDLAHLHFVESLVHLVFQRVDPRCHGRVVGLGHLVPPAQPHISSDTRAQLTLQTPSKRTTAKCRHRSQHVTIWHTGYLVFAES